MSGNITSPGSRRTFLAAIGAAAVGVVAQAIGRPAPVRAGGGNEGDVMHVGGDHLGAETATQLKITGGDHDVFIATSTQRGRAIYGQSTYNSGVVGQTTSFSVPAVLGFVVGPHGTGVEGRNEGAGHTGWLGGDSEGVYGNGPEVGVTGGTYTGRAVSGSTTGSGVGVWAGNQAGFGVALHVEGHARFKRSGVATVPAGSDRVSVRHAPMRDDSFVLANLARYRQGSTSPLPTPDRMITWWIPVVWQLETLAKLSEHRSDRQWDPAWGQVVLEDAGEGLIIGGPHAGRRVSDTRSWSENRESLARDPERRAFYEEQLELQTATDGWPRVSLVESLWQNVRLRSPDGRDVSAVREAETRAAELGTTWDETVELVRLILEPRVGVGDRRAALPRRGLHGQACLPGR